MKTRLLSGRALDYAVALAEGRLPSTYQDNRGNWHVQMQGHPGRFDPTTGRVGDDIIDREYIDTLTMWDGGEKPEGWRAEAVGGFTWAEGATRREAAMRCYALKKLGEDIDIPKELM
jgi:hypothetical protein